MKTAYQQLPESLLDDEGYPTKEWLKFLQTYQPDESLTVITFVDMVLRDGWAYSSWGFKFGKKYKGKRKLCLSTAGWSGNEETIEALLSNRTLLFYLKYTSWRTGGHYTFEVKA